MLFAIVFWALCMQFFTSIILFTERNVNREFLGWTIPTGMFSSLIGLFVILLSPLFSMLWIWLNKTKRNPPTTVKFSMGLLLIGANFFVLALGSYLANDTGRVGLEWLLLGYLLFVCGELCLSPIGLSMVTKLAPKKLVGALIGVWFLTIAIGYAIAGRIAAVGHVPKEQFELVRSNAVYGSLFSYIGLTALLCGLFLLLLTPKLRNMMEENR